MMEWLIKIVSWLVPESVKRFFEDSLSSRPRRILVALLAFGFYAAWGGITDCKQIVRPALTSLSSAKITFDKLEVPVGAVAGFLWKARYTTFKFCGAFGFSLFICLAITSMIAVERGVVQPNALETLVMLLQKTGIIKIYPSQTKIQITDQMYAAEMKEAVARSQTVKLMMIAGFEYFGKGEDSLLFDIIKENPTKDVEFVLLDVDEGHEVVRTRVEKLRDRDASYSEEKLKHNVTTTCQALKTLKAHHTGKMDLYLCKHAPIFRLVILDKCLFFNTYAEGVHGHESPVYRVAQCEESDCNGALFESFNEFYTLLKSLAKYTALS